METANVLRDTVSISKVDKLVTQLSEGSAQSIDQVVNEAIKHEWQLVLVVDDYTAIHTIRRPLTTTLTHPKTMCTIIIKVFKNVPAIPAYPASSYLNPQAMNISSCINTVSGLQSMYRLTQTYASVMPAWITNTFFNPEFEIHRITTHNYCDHESVQTMRQMDNVHLVDFVELQLKSRDDFGAAYDIILSTKLSDYMKRYLLLQPGDWPAQFYSRQLVYESIQKYQSNFPPSELSPGPWTKPTSHLDHSYPTPCNTSGPAKEQDTSDQPTILSIIPCIGPLHITLNA